MENTTPPLAGMPAHSSKAGMIGLSVAMLVVGLVAGYYLGNSKSGNVAYQTTTPTVSSLISPSTSPTPIASAIPVTTANLPTIFGLADKIPGTKLYYSDKLGVGFTYNPKLASTYAYILKINEVGNVIHLQVLLGGKLQTENTIEVFSKDPGVTLTQAINSKFLAGYDPKNCWVETEPSWQDAQSYVAAQITYPPVNDLEEMVQAQKKCPLNYTRTNAGTYFAMNTDVPSKFFFVRLGQDFLTDDGTPVKGDASPFGWDRSIRVLK